MAQSNYQKYNLAFMQIINALLNITDNILNSADQGKLRILKYSKYYKYSNMTYPKCCVSSDDDDLVLQK